MTLKIEVTVPEDDIKSGGGADYLSRAMKAIGFERGVTLPLPKVEPQQSCLEQVAQPLQERKADPAPDAPVAEETQSPAEPSARCYGQPEEGKARRNKDQMAEDKAIEDLAAASGMSEIPTDIPAVDLLAKLKSGEIAAPKEDPAPAEKANISTGEERIDPADAETQAQDKADEKAEVEAARDGLTLDDLREVVGEYQKVHGMAATVENIPALLGCAVAEVKPEDLEGAIAKVRAEIGITGDIPGPNTVEEKPAPFTASKNDVIEEMLRYADKFDGQRTNPGEATAMIEDRAKILLAAFGDGIDGLSKIPDTPEAYGKAVLALREAIEKNPYGREVKA